MKAWETLLLSWAIRALLKVTTPPIPSITTITLPPMKKMKNHFPSHRRSQSSISPVMPVSLAIASKRALWSTIRIAATLIVKMMIWRVSALRAETARNWIEKGLEEDGQLILRRESSLLNLFRSSRGCMICLSITLIRLQICLNSTISALRTHSELFNSINLLIKVS